MLLLSGNDWYKMNINLKDLIICESLYGNMIFPRNDMVVGRSLPLYGEWSEGENIVMSQFVNNGDSVIDIGANIGTTAISLSRSVGESGNVFAFEPQQIISQCLSANVLLNNIKNIEVYTLAVSSKSGWVYLDTDELSMKGRYGSVSIADKGHLVKSINLNNFKIENFYDDAELTDLRMSQAGDLDLEGNTIDICRGIEVGHIFKLGQKYSEKMKAKITTKDSKSINMFMGCYGIGVTRIVAAAIEQNHDSNGIIWPKSISPFEVVIIEIDGHKNKEVRSHSSEIYDLLQNSKISRIYDDRDASFGNKMKDWELIGVPNIVIIGKNEAKNKTITYKSRLGNEKLEIKIEDLINKITL